MMIEIFTFFELLSDMVKNNISMAKMLDYLFNLAPKLVYDSTPMARAGGNIDLLRHIDQAQRSHCLQGRRHQRIPSGGSRFVRGSFSQLSSICLRFLLCPGGKPASGSPPRRK